MEYSPRQKKQLLVRINGVYRYDGKELYHLKFPEYDIASAYGYKEENPSYSPYGVYSVYKDKRGQLWFGTLSSGVYAYQGEQSFWISEKELGTLDDGRVPGVRSILEDKDGNFWLSNILGRYRMHEVNSDTNLTRYEKLPGIQVPEGAATMELPYFMSAVTDDENGDLWMLTYSEGIWRYDGESFINYQVMDGDKEVLLFKLYKDREGTIWVGTHEAGIYRWNGEGFVPANSFATSNKRRKE